jgi:hypothetical protein
MQFLLKTKSRKWIKFFNENILYFNRYFILSKLLESVVASLELIK